MTDSGEQKAEAPVEVRVGKASMLLASGTMVSRVLGFVRSILLVMTIGQATNAADAFGIANQLPNTLYQLTAGGVLTAVLVPQIVAATKGKNGGSDFINRIATLGLLIFTAAAAITTLAAPFLVDLYTSGWSADRLALATAMAYWCLPQVFFYGLYSLLGGILNAKNIFGPYTWAPVLNNVIAIVGLGAFVVLFGADPLGITPVADWTPAMVSVLAGSATLGIAAQALILFAFWRRAGLRYRLDFTFRGVGLGAAGRAAGWILAAVVVQALVGLVQSIVASGATANRADGDVTLLGNLALGNIWLVYALPHAIATVSIATVYFTRFSEQWADHDRGGLRESISQSIRQVGVITVLATAVMMVTSLPLMSFYSGGVFELNAALALALVFTLVGLVPYSADFLLIRAFYAMDDTRTPFLVAAGSAVVRVIAFFAIGWWTDPHLVVAGISLVVGLANWLEFLIDFVILQRRLDGLDGPRILRTHVRLIIAALLAAAVGLPGAYLFGAFTEGTVLNSLGLSALVVIGVGVVMTTVYYGGIRVMHVREATDVANRLLGRLRRH